MIIATEYFENALRAQEHAHSAFSNLRNITEGDEQTDYTKLCLASVHLKFALESVEICLQYVMKDLGLGVKSTEEIMEEPC